MPVLFRFLLLIMCQAISFGSLLWKGFKSQGEGKEKEAGLSVILIIRKYLLEANRQL